jgi:tRNA(Arg) A34 adenosine deaminase TadA
MSLDEHFLRRAMDIAELSVSHLNQPFGAIIVDCDGNVLITAENTELTEDLTCHAEMNAVRTAVKKKISPEVLSKATLYTSTEPCVMCTATIIRSKIGRIVYACPALLMSAIIGKGGSLPIQCKDICSKCTRPIEVVGPMIQEEAAKVHWNYWPKLAQNQEKKSS